MTSGRCWEARLIAWCISNMHCSSPEVPHLQRLPDVIVRRSFTRPSTALAVIEGLGTRLMQNYYKQSNTLEPGWSGSENMKRGRNATIFSLLVFLHFPVGWVQAGHLLSPLDYSVEILQGERKHKGDNSPVILQ